MAKVRNNIIIKGLSGDLGKQLRIRTSRISGRTSVSAIADFDNKRKDSPAQAAQKQAFREAAAYADKNEGNPVYVAKAKGKDRQPYNVAMSDWFHPPQILEIDLVGWRGGVGDVIRVLAVDDVQVAQVRIEIRDERGTILEAGEAVQHYTQWWEYVVKGPMRGELTVTVTACDLPGHVAQSSASKGLFLA